MKLLPIYTHEEDLPFTESSWLNLDYRTVGYYRDSHLQVDSIYATPLEETDDYVRLSYEATQGI